VGEPVPDLGGRRSGLPQQLEPHRQVSGQVQVPAVVPLHLPDPAARDGPGSGEDDVVERDAVVVRDDGPHPLGQAAVINRLRQFLHEDDPLGAVVVARHVEDGGGERQLG
jgi:hypothetical protein